MSDNYYIATTSYNIPMTISVWIYTDLSYYMTVLGLRGGIQLDIFPSGAVSAYCALPDAWSAVPTAAAGSLRANTWTHLAVTITASYTASLYINGVFIDLRTGSGSLPSYSELVIGGCGFNSRGYNGYMQDLQMYNKALSATEISDLYTSVIPIVHIPIISPSVAPTIQGLD